MGSPNGGSDDEEEDASYSCLFCLSLRLGGNWTTLA